MAKGNPVDGQNTSRAEANGLIGRRQKGAN